MDTNERLNEVAGAPRGLAIGRATDAPSTRVDRLGRRADRSFIAAAVAGVLAFGVWANMAEIDMVTRATGSIAPQETNQFVQHFEGGIVSEILVREGDVVENGAPIIRVTDQRWISGLEQARFELAAKRALQARLRAEATGATTLSAQDAIAAEPGLLIAERALFDQRQSALRERLLAYDDQIRRLMLQLAELSERRESIDVERQLIEERVESLASLSRRGAVSRNEELQALTDLQRIKTKLSDLRFAIPQTEAELSEVRRRREQETLDFRAEAGEELAGVDVDIAKLLETIETFEDREARSAVRAPVSGVVNKLFVTTLGGVVSEGQRIAEIVPVGDAVEIDVRLKPEDRARVWPGMPAIVKISAYEYSDYGGVDAEVASISADALEDERGEPYFRVTLSSEATDFGPDKPILPGMVASVDMLSGKRTVLTYLLEPIRRVGREAMTE